MFSLRRIRYILLLPVAVIIIGTAGFMLIEKFSFLDALYFTVVTIATVGYGDVSPATAGGKIFAMFIIVIGIGAFLTLLTSLAQWLAQRRQISMHRHRRSMLIGVFFTEVGNELLRIFSGFDSGIAAARKDFRVTAEWSSSQFRQLKKHLGAYEFRIDPARLDLEKAYVFLKEKGDFLVHHLEITDLVENESFAELLWSIVHLRDELAARHSLKGLPATDTAHLANDVKRAYSRLAEEWIDYMEFLKDRYPFLFSLALRTNPFVENPDAVIKQ